MAIFCIEINLATLLTTSALTGDGYKRPVYLTIAKVQKANCERGKLFLVVLANVWHRAITKKRL